MRSKVAGVVGLLFGVASVSHAQSFTDVTTTAALTYLQHSGLVTPNCVLGGGLACEPERMSGGAAVADIDGDGDLDLFVTRLDAPDILFRNRGNAEGKFEDVTAAAGLAGFDFQTNGASFGDIDNDGDPDLYVTVMGDFDDPVNTRNLLFINDGTGVFSEEGRERGAAVASKRDRQMFSVVFGDYDRDGWLDIHMTEWGFGPAHNSHSRLLRNRGSASPGYFEDVTYSAGVVLNGTHGFASSFTDLDGDHWPDLAVAADFGSSKLYWNNGNGSFVNGTAAANVGTDENGMGSTFGDIDGDGDLDWFVTSIYDPAGTCDPPPDPPPCTWGNSGNRLYRNEGSRVFSDFTDGAGVRIGHWGWGTAFLDFDNDADLDLVMTNGVIYPAPGETYEDPFNTDPMRCWENDGSASMTEISAAAGLDDTGSGKGLLVFDYDDDGDQDIFLVNNAASGLLYRNDSGNLNDWLRVQTQGSASNRDGIGARIEVEPVLGGPVQVRQVGTSTHFLAQSELIAHFGLGAGSDPVDRVRVEWPSGTVQDFLEVARNTTLLAVEPACTDADGDGYCAGLDCNDAAPLVHPGQWDVCSDTVDNNCNSQTDEAGCVDKVGSVPDGAGVPGAQLSVEQLTPTVLQLTWGVSCAAADTDYVVYEGQLGDFTSHDPVQIPGKSACSTGGLTTAAFTPGSGDTYYFVASIRNGNEGSYGQGRNGFERPQNTTACRIRALGTCD